MEVIIDATGVATDGRGHIFVVDNANACVQMFRTDGVYLGAILKYAERQRPTGQWRICWCAGLSSLVLVSMQQNDAFTVGVFRISSLQDDTGENSGVTAMAVETAAEYNWKRTSHSCSFLVHLSYWYWYNIVV